MKNNTQKYDDELIVKYKDKEIKANLIYRARKSISIQIKPVDNIFVISPKKVSKKILKDLLIEKGDWILEKLEQYKEVEDFYKEKEYVSGEKFYYLGIEHTLEIIEDLSLINKKVNTIIEAKDDKIKIISSNIENEYLKDSLKKWYKKESEKLVIDRILHCREKSQVMMKLIPSSVKVKEQKKRWGSCTSKRDIYINSKISMARPEVIDYILVHEFSHLVHMNHSKEFYNLVRSIMPNYKIHEKWLKDNSYKLTL